jgi:predicted lipase
MMRFFVPMQNNLDYGYMAEYKDKLVICFKGTKNIAAWVSDFDVYPLRSDYLFVDGNWGKGTIADGFYTGWSAFKSTISDYIKNNLINGSLSKKIICTGMSRGGTLAILAARHIAKNLKLPCSCISFGSPAPGSSVLRDEIDILPINLTRVVYGKDPVPTLPPERFGFRQPGKLLSLPAPGVTLPLRIFRIKHHFYSSYTKGIMNYCIKKGDDHGYQEMLNILPTVKT